VQQITKISLFSDLTHEQLETLKQEMYIHTYKKDKIIFYEGDSSEYLHILLKGSVEMYKTTPKGNSVVIHHFHAPDIIAIFASLKDIPFPASCKLTTDGSIGLLPLKKLYSCMQNVDFSHKITQSLADKMELLADLIQRETIYSTEAKVADIIQKDIDIFKRLKHHEIAKILNIASESLSRTLTKFKKEKIIEEKEHSIYIVNEEKLLEIIDTNTIPKF
jgi:CRP/FNR family transcriptional regulator